MTIASERTLFYNPARFPGGRVARMPVNLQVLKDDRFAHFCIRYRGNGHYFETAQQAEAYIKKRFNRAIHIVTHEERMVVQNGEQA